MTESVCHLCGLPLRYGAVSYTINDQTLKFCCRGCQMVTTMLFESTKVDDPAQFKQTDLYHQCVAAGVIPANEDDLRRIHETQQPSPPLPGTPPGDRASAPASSDTLALNLVVEGMWCTACAWVIEKTVSRLAVRAVSCHFSTDRLRCLYQPDRVAPDQIRNAVSRLGYAVRESDTEAAGQQTQRRELIRLIITGLLSANVMMLSWALYAGFFTTLSEGAISKISLPIVIMAALAFVFGGGPMLRKAWFSLVRGAPGMETLVGMGAGCAFVYSLINWLAGSIHLYFDTACMLITLVLLGKLLEQQAKGRVRRDLDSFFALQPAKVRLISDASPAGRYVAVDHLEPGDRFAVETDEIVPADGLVASGSGTLDASSLTGEPKPVKVKAGVRIKSGTRVIDGRVIATAQKVGEDTILGQMITIMARSLAQKSPFESRTDRMLRWFVPIIVAMALGTGLFCALTGLSIDQAVVRSVTVMVIACPCALGVAIPMARLAGISLAGRKGILVREIEAFERAAAVDTVVFDKTGTLTYGRWQLLDINCQRGYDPSTIVAWAAGLEKASDHEIARSIQAFARQRRIAPVKLADLRVFPDGIRGRLDHITLRIGNRGFARGSAPSMDPPTEETEDTLSSQIYLSADGHPVATLVFGDTIRPTVAATIEALRGKFQDIHLISGDGASATGEVARTIGLNHVRGDLMPADKADYIDALKRQGHQVTMVGDGVNDAPAMARADLAVAVHSGRGLAKAAAHITLMRGDPAQLLDFFPLSKRVNRKIAQNLWCAYSYNLISIPIAMSGLLTPLVAATAMLLSSLTVIGNTVLLVRHD